MIVSIIKKNEKHQFNKIDRCVKFKDKNKQEYITLISGDVYFTFEIDNQTKIYYTLNNTNIKTCYTIKKCQV